jgi:hypothetical protein
LLSADDAPRAVIADIAPAPPPVASRDKVVVEREAIN